MLSLADTVVVSEHIQQDEQQRTASESTAGSEHIDGYSAFDDKPPTPYYERKMAEALMIAPHGLYDYEADEDDPNQLATVVPCGVKWS